LKKIDEMKIVSQKEIAKNIFQLILQGKLVSEIERPGQFVHMKVGEGSIHFSADQSVFVRLIVKIKA